MNLQRENDRKGLVGTVFIHLILFLLLMIWTMGQANEMLEEQGGLEVSFGDPLEGGTDAISETSDASSSESQPESSNPSETPVDSKDDPVVTNNTAEAPEVKSKTTNEVEQPKESERGKVDSRITDFLKNKDKNKNSGENNTSAGPNNTNKPGGDPNAQKPGPGGTNKGTSGSGVSWSLDGFVVSGIPTIVNEQQDFGTITAKICLDENGKIKYFNFEGGTSSSPHLRGITKDAIYKFAFKALGNQTSYNCGTISITFKPH